MKYQIKLKHYQINELTFNPGQFGKSDGQSIQTNLRYSTAYKEDKSKEFIISFNLTLENKEIEFILTLRSTFYFETDKEINEEFKDSSFTRISAPAIAFPYLRTFISNLTLNAGYKPILLPSYNFVGMSEEISVPSGE